MDEMTGGTFTISNGGGSVSKFHAHSQRAPVRNTWDAYDSKNALSLLGDQCGNRPMMYLALSYDHRIVDGREAVSFSAYERMH